VKTFLKIPVLLLSAIMTVPLVCSAQPAKATAAAPAKPVPKKSVFVMPSSPKEGRDPFFPDSTRPYEAAVATSHVVEVTSLAVKGYSVVNGVPCVIINNHSFMAGDEGDVLTPGGRVHVRCLQIKPTVAIVDVNGRRHDLNF
jgi:hypothetical protein